MDFDLGEWIEEMVATIGLQSPAFNWVNVALGIGLMILGFRDYKKKDDEKIWSIIAMIAGAVMFVMNVWRLLS